MPSKEGRRWRGIVSKGGKKVAQQLFDTKREAQAWEVEYKRCMTTSKSSGLLLGEAVASYLAFCQHQFIHKTNRLKKTIFARFLQTVGAATPLADIKSSTIQSYLLAQAQIRSAYGANEDRKHLNAFWSWVESIHEDTPKNPIKRVPKFKEEIRPLYTPPQDDVSRVLAVAKGRTRAWLLAYVLTGAREKEINRLRWSDVDFDAGRICLWSRKTRCHALEPQWIAAPLGLTNALAALPRRSEFVFVHPVSGRPYCDRRKLMLALCRKAGVQPFTFHAMRRYVGSILAKSGRPIQEIQNLLRHKNLAHTEKYIRGLGVDLAPTVAALETLVMGNIPLDNPPRIRKVK